MECFDPKETKLDPDVDSLFHSTMAQTKKEKVIDKHREWREIGEWRECSWLSKGVDRMHENEEEEEVKLRERALKKKIGLAREILTDWKAVMTEKMEKKDGIEEECKWMLELVEKIGGETDLDVKERDEFIEKTIQTGKEGIRLMTEGACR